MFALEALAGRMRARWILAALCVRIALRPLVITRPLGPDEVLGALLALVLWELLRERVRLRVSIGMLAVAVLISELAPFRFSSMPGEFSWIPFQAIETERQGMVLALFRKAFDYGGLVWLLYLAGASYARAGVAVAVFVGVLEAVQRYVPGRHPSITDPVLIVLIAMGLALTDRSSA
jgi:VanZ family protein